MSDGNGARWQFGQNVTAAVDVSDFGNLAFTAYGPDYEAALHLARRLVHGVSLLELAEDAAVLLGEQVEERDDDPQT